MSKGTFVSSIFFMIKNLHVLDDRKENGQKIFIIMCFFEFKKNKIISVL